VRRTASRFLLSSRTIASESDLDVSEEAKPKIRVPGQALREQRAEPGPSPVEDATRKIPDNRVARGFREPRKRYLKQAKELASLQSSPSEMNAR